MRAVEDARGTRDDGSLDLADEPAALEPVQPDPAAPATPAARRSVPATMWVALAVLAAIALGTSILAASATAARERDRRDRQEVEEVAGRLATALSTYDYRDFEATKRRVLALSTGSFYSEYDEAVGALASVIDQVKATSEATAGDVFVGNLGDGKASAIVVVEIRANGVGGPRVSVDNYVDLSLVKVEGEWKVDGVRNLNLGVSGSAPAAGPAAPAGPSTPGSTAATTPRPAGP